MNSQSFILILNRFILLFGAIILVSCDDDNGSNLPPVEDPPPFDYEEGEGVRSGMHQLAYAVLTLDWALADEENTELVDQQAVVEILQKIRLIAEDLQQREFIDQHPHMTGDMYRFLTDVDQAIFDASKRNPSYYMAGRVSGACVACHVTNE